jgi:hypothetical protein
MSGYVNLNKCKSFNQALPGSSALTPLQSQVCSEVIMVNRSGDDIIIFDNGNDAAGNGFLLGDNESVTMRGLTNSDQLSATSASGGLIYYRAQYFSNNPSR